MSNSLSPLGHSRAKEGSNALTKSVPTGYAQSSHNATKHNIFASDLCVSGEDPADFELLLEGLVRDLKPNGEYQHLLVRKIAENEWRGRRVIVAESALLKRAVQSTKTIRLAEASACRTKRMTPPELAIELQGTNSPGEAVANALASHTLQLLMRYSTAINREADRLIRLYRELSKENFIAIDFAEGAE
jgi:hypothetical protein